MSPIIRPREVLRCDWGDCAKLFNTRGRLKRHINDVHTQLVRYQCGQCRFYSTQEANLKSHMRTHRGRGGIEGTHQAMASSSYTFYSFPGTSTTPFDNLYASSPASLCGLNGENNTQVENGGGFNSFSAEFPDPASSLLGSDFMSYEIPEISIPAVDLIHHSVHEDKYALRASETTSPDENVNTLFHMSEEQGLWQYLSAYLMPAPAVYATIGSSAPSHATSTSHVFSVDSPFPASQDSSHPQSRPMAFLGATMPDPVCPAILHFDADLAHPQPTSHASFYSFDHLSFPTI